MLNLYFFRLWLKRTRLEIADYLRLYDMTFEPDAFAIAALLAMSED